MNFYDIPLKERQKVLGIILLRQTSSPYIRESYPELKHFSQQGLPEAADPGFQAIAKVLDNAETIERAFRNLKEWEQRGIATISIAEETYPQQLRAIHDPPPALFCRGCTEILLNPFQFAVVGSRAARPEGCRLARRFGEDLSAGGIVVVSGLALGIDAAAHEGALAGSASGNTIAVLGSGPDQIYPSSHEQLAEKILECGGLILSQFEPGSKPYPSHFLNRNRVIAGLSRGVLVVQAAARSGALATARFALEEGRDVFAVPGSVSDPLHAGTHALLKQGAHVVTEANDIFNAFPECAVRAKINERVVQTGDRHEILKLFNGTSELAVSEIQKMLPLKNLAEELLLLEISGALERVPGNRIKIVQKD